MKSNLEIELLGLTNNIDTFPNWHNDIHKKLKLKHYVEDLNQQILNKDLTDTFNSDYNNRYFPPKNNIEAGPITLASIASERKLYEKVNKPTNVVGLHNIKLNPTVEERELYEKKNGHPMDIAESYVIQNPPVKNENEYKNYVHKFYNEYLEEFANEKEAKRIIDLSYIRRYGDPKLKTEYKIYLPNPEERKKLFFEVKDFDQRLEETVEDLVSNIFNEYKNSEKFKLKEDEKEVIKDFNQRLEVKELEHISKSKLSKKEREAQTQQLPMIHSALSEEQYEHSESPVSSTESSMASLHVHEKITYDDMINSLIKAFKENGNKPLTIEGSTFYFELTNKGGPKLVQKNETGEINYYKNEGKKLTTNFYDEYFSQKSGKSHKEQEHIKEHAHLQHESAGLKPMTIAQLKSRFNILKGEILASNDNPEIIAEIKHITKKLHEKGLLHKSL